MANGIVAFRSGLLIEELLSHEQLVTRRVDPVVGRAAKSIRLPVRVQMSHKTMFESSKSKLVKGYSMTKHA